MKKLLILSLFCAFCLAEGIAVSVKSESDVIKDDIMYIYADFLNGVDIKEKGGKLQIELTGKANISQRDFDAMANDIKTKVNVILQKNCVVKFNVANKLIFQD